MDIGFSPQTLYRLPWNFADNAISWLEPTSKCNLYCDGCYRENRKNSHRTLEEIQTHLDVFERLRKTDGVSIAGGEPLTHPEICEIVKMCKKKGWKAIINTNGALLTKELLHELRLAGVDGFTFHIDSGQNRPGWKDKNEIELNELRLQIAEMLAREGGDISCSFNSTVYPETLKYVPDVLKWSQKYMNIVHVMVFIIYRMAITNRNLDFYVADRQVTFDDMVYAKEEDARPIDIMAPDVVREIRKIYPEFMPSAYLNGTMRTDHYKWLLTGRMGNKHEIFGYVGPKFMELVQTFKHIFTDKYLAYSHPCNLRKGRLYFLLAPFDKGISKIAKNYFKSFSNNPKAFFSRLHHQSVLIIQPADIDEHGEVSMCDGCPDITVWNNQLVWSCRMEEQNRWGQNVRIVPHSEVKDKDIEKQIERILITDKEAIQK